MSNSDPVVPNINNGELVYALFPGGKNSRIECGSIPAIHEPDDPKKVRFGVCGWIYPMDADYIATKQQLLFAIASAEFQYTIFLEKGCLSAPNGVQSTVSLAPDMWHYFSINYGCFPGESQPTWRIYIDGELCGTGPLGPTPEFSDGYYPVYIGGEPTCSLWGFKGKLQSLGIFNEIIDNDSSVLSNLYFSPVAADDAVAYYDLAKGKNTAELTHDFDAPAVNPPLNPVNVTYQREIKALTCLNDAGKVIDGCALFDTAPLFVWDYSHPFTIETWIFVPDCESFEERKHIFSKDARYGEQMAVTAILLCQDRTVSFVIFFQDQQKAYEVISQTALSRNTWVHVAAVYAPNPFDESEASLSILINGVQDVETRMPFTRIVEDKCYLSIGGMKTIGYSGTYPGYIQELRIWDADRSDKIEQNMRCFPEDANPLAYFVFGLDDRDVTDLMLKTKGVLKDGARTAPQTVVVTRPGGRSSVSRKGWRKGDLKSIGRPLNSVEDVQSVLEQLLAFAELWNIGGKNLGYPQLNFWTAEAMRALQIAIQMSDIVTGLQNYINGQMSAAQLAGIMTGYPIDQMIGAVSSFAQNDDKPTNNGNRKRPRENPFDSIGSLTDRDQQLLKRARTQTKTILQGELSLVVLSLLQASDGDCIEVITLDIVPDPLDITMHAMLIDGGRRGSLAALNADGQLCDYYDVICSTHQDRDHIAGLIRLFELRGGQRPCDEFWMNTPPPAAIDDEERLTAGQLHSYQDADDLVQLALTCGLSVDGKKLGDDDVMLGDNLTIRFIGPSSANLQNYQTGRSGDSHIINRASIMNYLTHSKISTFNAILTADGEDYGTDATHQDIRSGMGAATAMFQFMKVPHHGSEVTEDAGFYNAYKAKYYLLSAKDNTSPRNPRFNTLRNIIEANVPGDSANAINFGLYLTNYGTQYNDAITQILTSPTLNPDTRGYQMGVLRRNCGRMTFLIAPLNIVLGPLNADIYGPIE